MQVDIVKIRERKFHNERFSAGGARGSTARFYAITGEAEDHYRDLVLTHGAGRHVLELGCGLGGEASNLASHGAIVTGVDISDVAVQQATDSASSKGLKTTSFHVMDAENLDFNANSFDLICGSSIIHHLNIERAYSELSRCLKRDGCAVLYEPLGHNPIINLYRRLTPSLRTIDEHPLLWRDIEQAKFYFSNVEATFFFLNTLMAIPFRRTQVFSNLVKWFNGADRVLFRTFPGARRFAWFVVMLLSGPKNVSP